MESMITALTKSQEQAAVTRGDTEAAHAHLNHTKPSEANSESPSLSNSVNSVHRGPIQLHVDHHVQLEGSALSRIHNEIRASRLPDCSPSRGSLSSLAVDPCQRSKLKIGPILQRDLDRSWVYHQTSGQVHLEPG